MDIDAIIAEADETPATEQPAQEIPPEEPKQEAETAEDVAKKPDSELTPEQLVKREKNRESHLNSKLADMRRANRELQAQLAQQQKPPVNQPGDPKEPDFNDPYYKDKSFGEFTKDYAKWVAKHEYSENTRTTQEAQRAEQFNQWKDQRGDLIDQRLPELQKLIPDYEQVVPAAEMQLLAESLTPEQARIVLEAEDINLAVYTLRKEGKLEDVIKLPPLQLATAIAKAEVRGEQYLSPPKPITNAPRPMATAKGVGVGSKGDADIVDEILAYVRK